jgi:nucleoside-diphosphate-sugar epimerase
MRLDTPMQQHDFIHASDVGRAVATAVEHGLRGVIPIGSGRLRRVADLVEATGASWEAGDPPNGSTALSHGTGPADTTSLTAVGWRPTSTEEYFAHVS